MCSMTPRLRVCSQPTYKGWKQPVPELQAPEGVAGSQPTYKGWKRVSKDGNTLNPIWVPSLPTRDGNGFR